jgi:hypothetical protein
MIVNIVGWGLLILSWVIPGNTENKKLARLLLSSVALGIFVGALLHKFFK